MTLWKPAGPQQLWIHFLGAAFPFNMDMAHCLKSTHLWGWLCESFAQEMLKLSACVCVGRRLMEDGGGSSL